ncbi:SGNH/GDSL hydrolase family protein [Pseudomonas oryzihabitans]|uniref:SGNH/GDSL hydrolase family protein n=1 Tax=Pseudomonas oryzihabitans TaxID=47885 RepID=UPI0028950470|nr:SGNH/GDSL hydrolase family protein [Pseudomonas oryzihabitans]MDT3720190.1 SGNH/GDSL hydrolase family protein [Pseudomonas oryzihabitans]
MAVPPVSPRLAKAGSLLCTLALGLLAGEAARAGEAVRPTHWVATWQASPQPVWGDDFLFPTQLPSGLHDQTVRQVARLSLGGDRVRLLFSNAYGRQPVTLGPVTLALPTATATAGSIAADSLKTVTFSGQPTSVIPAGGELLSDPVSLPVADLAQVVVSFYLPRPTPMTTFHWDGRQTGWIVPGDQTRTLRLATGGQALETTARPLLAGVQVATATPRRSVVVIGDSITDGATASLDRDQRWPDVLAERLAPQGVAVVNAGISGARLLNDGMGVKALDRLDRDVLAQPGVASVIVLLGINDIAWPGTAFARTASRPTLEELIAGYRQLVQRAHARGLRVMGATLTPFAGALPDTPLADYYQPAKEELRQRLNAWIRTAGAFDALLDADAALRDPRQPTRLAPDYDSGDHLHPGDAGNRALAAAVDLAALLPEVESGPQP